MTDGMPEHDRLIRQHAVVNATFDAPACDKKAP